MPVGYAETVFLGFLVGLTGALAPGPTLIATIDSAMKNGWTAGPKVTLGHILIEAVLVIVIILGLSSLAVGLSAPIALLGGISLIVFGILTISGSRNAGIGLTQSESSTGPYVSGFLTSATNPYFWIWWLTIGSVLLVTTLVGGAILAICFLVGHWAADLGWYTLVSSAIHRGRTVLPERGYRIVLVCCGIFLVGFGGYYLYTAAKITGVLF